MAEPLSFQQALEGLKAAGEATRLRLLLLLAEAELTVTELVDILRQSQPRISRHLKLLAEAGLVERFREGAWAFYRKAGRGPGADAADALLGLVDPADPVVARDRVRLTEVRAARAAAAQAHFARLAPEWDRIRSLHVAEEAVEQAIVEAAGTQPAGTLLDLGTGTGRMLQLLAPKVGHAVGLDASPAMLAIARANLEKAGIRNAEVRQGDLFAPPFVSASFDLVVVHSVLHYLDDPAGALRQAASLVAPGGRLLVVDFAAHTQEFLRSEFGHRRLGFAPSEVAGWMQAAGLDVIAERALEPPGGEGDKLTVLLWVGRDRRAGRAEDRTREVA
ncbi:metalloregulator ArsR/SmtB family transcription factor [Blastochloris sulfoviridis]|uniref:Metalloregulator ArsR/SmtB family transcription factor n=1 Tax=Blastochloris sulfoviridis TaxID=50712 RepID=A0A5M6HVV3_9HYPH|nr:metalloregulator ArsR/SmtB family transcription factor [Blastochloris sulfoviridis]KAA5599865.1 metalloregulator ArsR/SmtB family transcription factor [Blastochloris sulfoviridis]